MLAGYARVSTLDQNPELQFDALRDVRSYPFISDVIRSGRKDGEFGDLAFAGLVYG